MSHQTLPGRAEGCLTKLRRKAGEEGLKFNLQNVETKVNKLAKPNGNTGHLIVMTHLEELSE